MEIWKDVKGYEGKYEVSNTGKVRSLDRITKTANGRQVYYKGKEIKPKQNWKGYLQVELNNSGKKLFRVHRLVAEAFLNNPNGYGQVNHIDEDKLNNNVCNLEWCTAEYNVNYGTRISRISAKKKVPINQYDLNGKFIRRWESGIDIEKETGISRKHIPSVARGERSQTGGYIWRYAYTA